MDLSEIRSWEKKKNREINLAIYHANVLTNSLVGAIIASTISPMAEKMMR